MQSKANELEDTLDSEDDDERSVDDVQPVIEVLRLLVMFQTHYYHVEHNHYHDEDVELLVCHDGKDEALNQQLPYEQNSVKPTYCFYR